MLFRSLVLKAFLDAKGHTTTLAVDGEEALNAYFSDPFDFCILDVMMPLKDGFTLAREIRKTNKKIPILFLTAKSLPEDKIRGFNAGADDYLTKPFSMDELLVRIRAIMRRAGGFKNETPDHLTFRLGKYVFDHTQQVMKLEDAEQKLTSKEANLLKFLCENPNDVVDRSLILKSVWADDSYFNARSMDVYMSKLRKYLQDDPRVEILNEHGVGFKLVIPMEGV
mgnify:FL=1